MAVPRAVPWASWSEWEWVCESLFGSCGAERCAALARVRTWQLRGGVPHAVESTCLLVEVEAMGDGSTFRLAAAMAVTRCVNGLVDAGQTRQQAVSISVLADGLGLPGWVVDVRHGATHNALPSARVLRSACATLVSYLRGRYWDPQRQRLQDLRRVVDVEIDAWLARGVPSAAKKRAATLSGDFAALAPATLRHVAVPAIVAHSVLLKAPDPSVARAFLRALRAHWPPADASLVDALVAAADGAGGGGDGRDAKAAAAWLPVLLSAEWHGAKTGDALRRKLLDAGVDVQALWSRAVRDADASTSGLGEALAAVVAKAPPKKKRDRAALPSLEALEARLAKRRRPSEDGAPDDAPPPPRDEGAIWTRRATPT